MPGKSMAPYKSSVYEWYARMISLVHGLFDITLGISMCGLAAGFV